MEKFIGRKNELASLHSLLDKRSASMVVVKGRRRIGKSRLIEEFTKRFIFSQVYIFSGLAPTSDTTAQSQRDAFASQLGPILGVNGISLNDWSSLFLLLADKAKEGKVVILFDEISWMGSKDSDFLGKLKNAWDLHFKKNPQLILVLCGSVSSWIEKNILSSTGFVGRLSLALTVRDLPLNDCSIFWDTYIDQASSFDKFKVLAVTGGVPLYLEHINPKISAEENITSLCFRSSGLLYREFDNIFSDLFSKRNKLYKLIVETLSGGPLDQEEICKSLGISRSGDIGDYLNDLIASGFITRDFTWHFISGKASKLSLYRICDLYARFYIKYIEPNKHKIEHDQFELATKVSSLPNFSTIMGFQFEALVLNNRSKIWDALNIDPAEIIFDNPFFQRPSKQRLGCQIDYLIQTRFNTIYICEIKFSQNELKTNVIKEMQEKLTRLKIPKHFSYRPVLIHVNGVTEEVVEQRFFSHIISFGDMLKI